MAHRQTSCYFLHQGLSGSLKRVLFLCHRRLECSSSGVCTVRTDPWVSRSCTLPVVVSVYPPGPGCSNLRQNYSQDIQSFQKTLSEENQKVSSRDPKVMRVVSNPCFGRKKQPLIFYSSFIQTIVIFKKKREVNKFQQKDTFACSSL